MANISDSKREDLGTAFNKSINEIREFIVKFLRYQHGDNWENSIQYYLTDKQYSNWKYNISQGNDPIGAFHYSYLKSFAIRGIKELKDYLECDVHALATDFGKAADVRHLWAHSQPISNTDYDKAFSALSAIAEALNKHDLLKQLEALRYKKEGDRTDIEAKVKDVSEVSTLKDTSGLPPWFKVVMPHRDVRDGVLDEAVFAANLMEVSQGDGRPIYRDADQFFRKTYFTNGLRDISQRVLKGLDGITDAENRAVSLQTGFGGGKTHTLITLYHLARLGQKINAHPSLKELSSYVGEVSFDAANIAVFTNATNDPATGREVEGITINTLWGELAYQLGGKAGYELVRENDEQRIAPSGKFKPLLEQHAPSLILIDELADYCVKAGGVEVGAVNLSDQTISFMQELTEAIAAVPKCVLVVTLPASEFETASSQEGHKVLHSLEARVGRLSADTKPVNDSEIFEVVRARLFEDIGDEQQRQQVADAYMELYEQLDKSNAVPKRATRSTYREQLLKAYPFHPELIDVFRMRWASSHTFQRTRGVLRLLSAITSDLWKRQNSLGGTNALIHTSDIQLSNVEPLVAQIKRLFGTGYEAVIASDLSQIAREIDQNNQEYNKYGIAEGVATTIMLNSFGKTDATQGIILGDIKLSILKPASFGSAFIDSAISKLESTASFLHYHKTGSGSRFWFTTEPNINIALNQAETDISSEEVDTAIVERLRIECNNKALDIPLKVLVAPGAEIAEQRQPTLIILHPTYTANGEPTQETQDHIKTIVDKRGTQARDYKNTLLFLGPQTNALNKLRSHIKKRMAVEKVSNDFKQALKKDQKEDLRTREKEVEGKIPRALTTTYSSVYRVMAEKKLEGASETVLLREQLKEYDKSFTEHIKTTLLNAIKEREWMVDQIGAAALSRFGLAPTEDTDVQVASINETFLKYNDKPILADEKVVKKTVANLVEANIFALGVKHEGELTKTYLGDASKLPSDDYVKNEAYYLIHKLKHIENEPPTGPIGPTPPENKGSTIEEPRVGIETKPPEDSTIKQLVISGAVEVENFSDLMSAFIMPLKSHNLKVSVHIEASSTEKKPLSRKDQAFKIAEESAKQLNLNFEVS